ncbi:uncharacterized protein N7515_008817 [Penicillium bovifimosum]|uniref:Glycoprotease family protein n=1 Tax=Penicillium bovifimosum TaxID=126998 RepID=A0A9W9KXU6_9EURO|nr:uncharacterized protein N7515_008817 [Penicillium bovifimosum]KAJ5124992.1 hypothetical protein N7515_008817 [Penicillium bovifimosum]
MLSKQKPQPTLQVPVPNFPLSSPISEEISSPSCSSVEDHDEERNRPFAFLNKATRSAHREPSRLNIRGITKKRKSVAKPVGLNLVTDFTLAPAPARKASVTEELRTTAPFVDLNDLKMLSKVRERERSTQKSKELFKKRVSRGFQRMPDEGVHGEGGHPPNETSFLNLGDGNPFHDRHEHGISPSDRHVMIGLTVPRNESIERSRELDSAGTPLTPSIIVTPAREDAPWNAPSNASTEMLRPRVASSVYSQPTPRLWQHESNVPPVPAIPAQHSTAKQSSKTENGYPNTLGVEKNARPLSTSTWEDDSPPATPATLRPTEHKQGRLSVNTTASTNRPASQGWWTYLLSPLLGRSIKSPLSPSFPRDSPVTPSTSTTLAPPKQWIQREKEVSCFSPDTPETAAPMDEKAFELSSSFDTDHYQHGDERQQSPPPAYVSNASSRQNTMSFMFGSQTTQGEAAEYYQACAHELFSKTPYFECFNHVCSITPVNPAAVALNGTAEGSSSRGAGIVAVDASNVGSGLSGHRGTQAHENQVSVAGSTKSTKNEGLLIDIDSPRGSIATTTPAGYAVRAKEVRLLSPGSVTTFDSWDCSDVDEDEKDSVAPQAAKGGVESTRSKPTSADPVSVPVALATTARQSNGHGAPAPVAIPMPEPATTPAPAAASISAPPPQIAPVTNIHLPSPPPQQQAQPLQPIIQYVPVFSQAGHPSQMTAQESQPQVQELSRGIPEAPAIQPAPQVVSPRSEWPWGERDQSREQSQVPPPVTQGQTTGFEWAYSQQEQPRQPPVICGLPEHPKVKSGQPPVLGRQPTRGHANQPRGPPILQGRLSGSGWPFGIHAHPHSHAPPVAPVSQGLPTRSESQSRQAQRGSDVPQTERGLPQGSELAPQGHSQASEPISPGFQRAAGGPGSIPMSDMQAPAPAYTQYPRDAPLPPRYDLQPRYEHNPEAGVSIVNPSGAIGPHETRRRRLEREEATGRRLCGLWRGRGPFSKKNGRPGREGRTRRRWYFVICIFFFIIVIVATVLAVTLTRKGAATPVQSQWLNLTGYPPMPTGIATLAGTQPQTEKSTCVTPSSMWSCALPKDQRDANEPYNANQPNFRVSIQFRNGTYDNSTAVHSNTTGSLRVRNDDLFDPSPAAPREAEQAFLGQYSDNNSAPYAGEATPFYISMLSPISLSSASIYRRSGISNGTAYPNISSIIPPPDTNADGTAAAAMLYPLPSSQPIRLYNRNLPTEHYGFYTYFDKSIFLTSQDKSSPADTNGGVSKSSAHYRCTWSQTRFLVQIWTQPDKIGLQLLSPDTTATNTTTAATPTSTNKPTSSSSATDFSRPGSFPYPVTVTIDRHGGAEKKKMVYCYPVEDDGHYNITGAQLQLEDRAIGGELVNPASGLFKGLSGTRNGNGDGFGGVDGGSGGCGCQWVNWISRK